MSKVIGDQPVGFFIFLVVLGLTVSGRVIVREWVADVRARRKAVPVDPETLKKTALKPEEGKTLIGFDIPSVKHEPSFTLELLTSVEKLETLLKEKNIQIKALEQQVNNEQMHRQQFNKIKNLLESYLQDLRGQNVQFIHQVDELKRLDEENRRRIEEMQKIIDIKDGLITDYQAKLEESRIRLKVIAQSMPADENPFELPKKRFDAIPE